MNPNSFSTDWTLCSHCSLVTIIFKCMPLSGTGSLELGALVPDCLSKSLRSLRRCLYCLAFMLTSSCCVSLGLTASRSSSGFARGLLRSSSAWTLPCHNSVGHTSRSRRILGNLEVSRTSRFPRRWTLRGPRTALTSPLVALAMVPRNRLLQWDTLVHPQLRAASASMVHPQLRSRPRQNVLFKVLMYISLFPIALPRVLSNGR